MSRAIELTGVTRLPIAGDDLRATKTKHAVLVGVGEFGVESLGDGVGGRLSSVMRTGSSRHSAMVRAAIVGLSVAAVISAGAEESHWAYAPLRSTEAKSSADRFVDAKLGKPE